MSKPSATPHRLEILGVVAGAVEVARGPDRVRAVRRGDALRVGGDRGLQLGAVEQAGIAGAAVVVRDERVAGEEIAVERHGAGVTEAEDVSGALAGAAGDQEDDAARRALRGQLLDVQRDCPREDAGAVERDDDRRAEHACRLAARSRRVAEGLRAEPDRRRRLGAGHGAVKEQRPHLRRGELVRPGCPGSGGDPEHDEADGQRRPTLHRHAPASPHERLTVAASGVGWRGRLG